MDNYFQNKEKNAYFYAFSQPVSRVLSFKTIINLGIMLPQCSSGHGNGRAAHMFHTLHLMEFTADYCHQYSE